MAILDILKYPDETLKQKSLPAEKVDSSVKKLVKDMIETMHVSNGIGLAAPQVGILKRIIVIDLSCGEDESEIIALVNPEIIEADDMVDSEEGCLSVPQYVAHLQRAGRVVVGYTDLEGRGMQIEASGLMARALQHEIDHLDGLLIVDRISALKREMFEKRRQKALREAKA